MSLAEDHKYDDIINLPHHVSGRHPKMALSDRAAQFSPFAALTGHGAAIRETARLTDSFVELGEDKKEQLDGQIRLLMEIQSQNPEVEVTFFQPDLTKSGGSYVTARKKVKKVEGQGRRILFTDGTDIPAEYIFSFAGTPFGTNVDGIPPCRG